MRITFKNENEGGEIINRNIVIEHSPFYSEVTTVKTLLDKRDRSKKEFERNRDLTIAVTEALNIDLDRPE